VNGEKGLPIIAPHSKKVEGDGKVLWGARVGQNSTLTGESVAKRCRIRAPAKPVQRKGEKRKFCTCAGAKPHLCRRREDDSMDTANSRAAI